MGYTLSDINHDEPLFPEIRLKGDVTLWIAKDSRYFYLSRTSKGYGNPDFIGSAKVELNIDSVIIEVANGDVSGLVLSAEIS